MRRPWNEAAGAPRPVRAALVAVAIAALALPLAGCGSSGAGETGGGEAVSEQQGVAGRWGMDAPGEPWLEFSELGETTADAPESGPGSGARADGEVTGSDGCNAIASTYTVEDGVVVLAPSASTLMACPGVDDWLREAQRFAVEGDELVAFDGDGAEIGRLERSR